MEGVLHRVTDDLCCGAQMCDCDAPWVESFVDDGIDALTAWLERRNAFERYYEAREGQR